MTCDEIIKELKANASEKYKANVVNIYKKRAAFALIASSVSCVKRVRNAC